jgi:hypothetical protein
MALLERSGTFPLMDLELDVPQSPRGRAYLESLL